MPEAFPKLHNAAWPGVVGKEPGSNEPPLTLDTMLRLTAEAEVDGVKFDGVDLFLFAPHIDIVSDNDQLARLAETISSVHLVVGTVVAPVWEPTGGGSAFGNEQQRARFLDQVRDACRIANQFRELGIRPYGNVRIDSAGTPADWSQDTDRNQSLLAQTFRVAADIAADYGETLTAEGEICWGGMHSWKCMVDLLERVDRPDVLGFQADMAHTLLYTMGYNSPDASLLPDDYDWSDPGLLDAAYQQVADALRPWTNDFHVAQNDGTVHGTGSHDKTGRHCLANDPDGKLDIVRHAGYWLRDEVGSLTKACRHICWDGCMFPNKVMQDPQTWQDVLAAMVAVRADHGWNS